MLGKTLRGRYNIIKQLGSGGFGTTFVAEDLDLPGNPWCVVKQLKPQGADPSLVQTARRLFDTEAQVLYRLGRHDQIPQLFAHFEENQEFYLVQEYVEGEDLSQAFAVGVWDEVKVLALLQDILQVLTFVHSQNVIHRDIKPSNLIRRQSDGKFVLIDFGAVKEVRAIGANAGQQTTATVTIGSPGYMPNEQRGGKPRFSSDLYALGITAIQALTGVSPDRLQEDLVTGEVSWRHLTQVSKQLAGILDKMVRSRAIDRYQFAEEVLHNLQNLQFVPATKVTQPLGASTSQHQPIWRMGQVLAIVATAGVTFGVSQLLPSDRSESKSIPTVPPEILSLSSPTVPPAPEIAAKPTPPANKAADLLQQSHALMELQRYDEAIAALDRALKLKPDYPEAWIERGVALTKLQRYQEALNAYDEALKLQLGNGKTWYLRSEVLNKLERYAEAIASLDKAVAYQPESVESLQERGIALAGLQRYEEALAIYNEALKFQHHSAALWYQRGMLLNQLKRYDEAVAALDQVLEVQPDYPEAIVERSQALGQLQRYDEALAGIDKVLPSMSESALLWGERGFLLVQLERYDEAIASLDKAVQIKADDAAAWYQRGLALDKLQRYEEALAAFDRAVQFDGNSSDSWYRRGLVLEKLQRYQEAIVAYDKAIQIWPANQEAITSRKYLLEQNLGTEGNY